MLNYQYIENVCNISREINIELLDDSYNYSNSPISIGIVKRASMYNKLALFLLMKTRLRFSDLKSLNLPKGVENEKITIKQNKTDSLVCFNFTIYNPTLKIIFSKITDLNLYLNYESLRSELRWIVPREIQHELLNNNSCTHIFRHLEASFMLQNNFSKLRIAKMLGHSDITTQRVYTHDFKIMAY